MNTIEHFVAELAAQHSTVTVSNPYVDKNIADNLRLYLNAMISRPGKRILLVGEAPGYKGCKLTGIPFTSGRVFERFDHPLLTALAGRLRLADMEAENTATIVWEYLSRKKSPTPLFWNSFPFHPHPEGNEKKNRAPTAAEVEAGIHYLQRLNAIFRPELIAGIGTKGARCAKSALPERDVVCIRHPSFGGKKDFIRGMERILQE